MGLRFTENLEDYIPYAAKCMTWREVKASHEIENPQVVVGLDDIYGMVILLALGLGGALMVFFIECLTKAQKRKLIKTSPAFGRLNFGKFINEFVNYNTMFQVGPFLDGGCL